MKNTKRWVVLPPEIDDILRVEAKQSQRSIANMLKYFVAKYFVDFVEIEKKHGATIEEHVDNAAWADAVKKRRAHLNAESEMLSEEDED